MFAPSEPIHNVLSLPLLPGKPKSDHLISYSKEKVICASCCTDSRPTLSLLFSLQCSAALYPLQLLLFGGVPTCVACATSSQILLSCSISSFLFFCLTTQPPTPVPSSHPSHSFALQKDSQLLVATCGFFAFFSNTLFFLSLLLTTHLPTQCQDCS